MCVYMTVCDTKYRWYRMNNKSVDQQTGHVIAHL